MSYKKVGVVGAGQMGSGITQVIASCHLPVVMLDMSVAALDKGKSAIATSCDRLIKKEKMSVTEKQNLLSQITLSSMMSDLADCDLIIEAVTESFEIKSQIFKKLDEICKDSTDLASNTSSISITRLAAQTRRADRVAGMHFMNPVPLMVLVEGIKGLQTSNETFLRMKAFAEFLGKVWIESQDMPGFAVNRILMPMINEAVYVLQEGIATVEGIDQAMKLGTNQPMGPLTLADFIGLDTCLSIMNVLYEGFSDSKYRPCPLLIKYVEAGWLGRKAGRGFYSYS